MICDTVVLEEVPNKAVSIISFGYSLSAALVVALFGAGILMFLDLNQYIC